MSNLEQRNNKVLKRVMLIPVFMFGFAYALVPLYDVICEVTGLNGRSSNTSAEASQYVDQKREVAIRFITDTHPDMPWQFDATTKSLKVQPGAIQQISFSAKNMSAKGITGRAIPSVSPGAAAAYLKKTECFCFNEQVLAGGASVDMPVIFYLDPELPEHITDITLSYKFYNVTERVKSVAKL